MYIVTIMENIENIIIHQVTAGKPRLDSEETKALRHRAFRYATETVLQ